MEKKVFLKRDGSLDKLFSRLFDSGCSGFFICQATLWNQSETLKTSKELSGISVTAKKMAKMSKIRF